MAKEGLNKHRFFKKGGIPHWDDGLPLGNGKLGILVYGDEELRFSLDKPELWDRRVPPESKEQGFTYQNMVRCAKEDWAEHQRLFDKCYEHPYPTKLSAGRLTFHARLGQASGFLLDYTTASAVVVTDAGNFYVFAAAEEGVGVARVPADVEFEITAAQYLTKSEEDGGLGYPKAEFKREGDFYYTVQGTKTDCRFGVLVLEGKEGEERYLYFTVWSDDLDGCKSKLLAARQKGFEKLFAEHAKYWEEYYARSELHTGDEMFDRYYLVAQYLFASTSRLGGYPMALQGVWTADNGKLPPWKGDYHADVNLQMSYSAYLKGGRFDEGRVLCDYLWNGREKYAAVAKEFYGVEGYVIPAVSSIDGDPLGGWPMYALDPSSSVWLAKCFDDHYLYSGDEAFFAERAYPFLSNVAKATEGLLVERDGKLGFPLTASPEYNDCRPSAYLPSQSNFELSLLKWLFATMEKYAAKVGDADGAAHYGILSSKLNNYALNDDQTFRICKDEDLTGSHRHFSHLLAICPLYLWRADERKEDILKNIEKQESLGTALWTGWSYPCMAELCAYAGEGNRAYRYLRDYIEGFTGENGFHFNGDYKYYGYSALHYSPFSLEAVFGFCKALQDMLLACDGGFIAPFYAVPEKWKRGEISFKDLRVHGNVALSATMFDGEIAAFSLAVPKESTMTFLNVFKTDSPTFINEKGERFAFSCKRGEKFTFTAPRGNYRLEI